MTLLKASKFFLALLWLQGCVEGHVDFDAEVVCREVDGDGLCPKLSHLNSEVHIQPIDSVEARLGYDFAQSRKATWFDSLSLNAVNLPPQRSWLSDYGLSYTLPSDTRWSISFEDGSGTTLLPNASHLAFSGNLQDIGWKQTLTRLSFQNSDVFVGDLLIGLGEGERLQTDDGALYYGARFRWTLHRALALQLAYSQDQNSLPKDAIWWALNPGEDHKGFKNQRMAASFILNGKLASLRGLEASLGWQDNRIDNTGDTSRLGSAPTHYALDLSEILSQDLGGRGQTKREVFLASASYRILAEYILALHMGTFRAALDTPSLQVCGGINTAGDCVDPAEKSKSFRVQEWTYGLGKIDKDDWSLLLEAHEERYDRLYQNYHFLNGSSPRQKNMRLVQARISWNW